jgi:hypothetical protein
MPVASTIIVGSQAEGVIIIVLVAFWAATVSIVTNTSNALGVSEALGPTNQVLNGNLYYFSWAGFVTAIVLLVSYLQSAYGVDVMGEARNRGARLTLWAGMLASALVVMGSSARVKNDDCSPNLTFSETYCTRTKFALSLGVIGVAFSLIVVFAKLKDISSSFLLELVASTLLAILNGFGVAFITSAKGPGSAIGNLYYFSWVSCLVSAFLLVECFNQYTGGVYADQARAVWNGTPPSSPRNKNDGDIEVHALPDDSNI